MSTKAFIDELASLEPSLPPLLRHLQTLLKILNFRGSTAVH
jgi:hypothetical protein